MKSILFYSILAGMVLFSCQNKEQQYQQIAQQYIRQKQDKFIQQRLNNCRETQLRHAEKLADSIVLNFALNQLGDTLHKPAKLPRPHAPEQIQFDDQPIIGPIFKEKR